VSTEDVTATPCHRGTTAKGKANDTGGNGGGGGDITTKAGTDNGGGGEGGDVDGVDARARAAFTRAVADFKGVKSGVDPPECGGVESPECGGVDPPECGDISTWTAAPLDAKAFLRRVAGHIAAGRVVALRTLTSLPFPTKGEFVIASSKTLANKVRLNALFGHDDWLPVRTWLLQRDIPSLVDDAVMGRNKHADSDGNVFYDRLLHSSVALTSAAAEALPGAVFDDAFGTRWADIDGVSPAGDATQAPKCMEGGGGGSKAKENENEIEKEKEKETEKENENETENENENANENDKGRNMWWLDSLLREMGSLSAASGDKVPPALLHRSLAPLQEKWKQVTLEGVDVVFCGIHELVREQVVTPPDGSAHASQR
jgi:hypothetical protein